MGYSQSKLGALLRERRRARGLSRARASEALGIPAGTIEGWEIGRVAKPPIHDVLRLARLVGITTAEIDEAILGPREGAPTNGTPPATGGISLLEQVIDLYGWDERQAAAALGTSTARVRALRRGAEPIGLAESMALSALVGVHAAGAVNGTAAHEANGTLTNRLTTS